MIASFFPFQFTFSDQFLDKRMIHCDLTNLSADRIQSAVTDIRHIQLSILCHGCYHRRSHPI